MQNFEKRSSHLEFAFLFLTSLFYGVGWAGCRSVSICRRQAACIIIADNLFGLFTYYVNSLNASVVKSIINRLHL